LNQTGLNPIQPGLSLTQPDSNLTQDEIISFVAHDSLSWEYVNASINLAPYLEEKIQNIYQLDSFKFYRDR
jgi:hypothetical protein